VIVVDTSALMAVLHNEPRAASCTALLARETEVLICAGTLAEALIVAGRRHFAEKMTLLVADLRIEAVLLNKASAGRTAAAYARWGKGVHPAALNFGDCFAYALAAWNRCPLLFVGDNFGKTDVASALPMK
jgi:ribonuclease VapC